MSEDGSLLGFSEGIRTSEKPDGSWSTAREILPSATNQSLHLPARLGGGYVFYSLHTSETPVWRADTWTSELKPWVNLTEPVRDVVAGFDRIYLLLSQSGEVIALDAKSGEVTDPGSLPAAPGYSALAFADEWFGAVNTDVRGVLVSFDAGDSWHSTGIVDGQASLSVEGESIRIQTDQRAVRLTREGQFEAISPNPPTNEFEGYAPQRDALPPADPSSQGKGPRPLGDRPLLDATLHGWPRGDGTAYLTGRGSFGEVDLHTGQVRNVQPAAYPGVEPCDAVSFGEGAGFVCSERDRGTQIYRVTSAGQLALAASFRSARFVSPSGNGRLVVRGPCRDDSTTLDPSSSPYCVLSLEREVSLQEIRVRGDVGSERVVALGDGRVAVLIPPRLGSAGVLNLISGSSATQKPLKLPDDERVSNNLNAGFWLHGIQQISSTQLGTWVVTADGYRGVRVALDGTVTAAKDAGGPQEGSAFSGAYSLDITRGRETSNYGFEWHDVELPPGVAPWDYKHRKLRAGKRPLVGCSRVGCVYGDWLRIGWTDSERQKPEPQASGALVKAEAPPRTPFQGNAYAEWRMQCVPTRNASGPNVQLGVSLNTLAAERPRRGLAVGFLPAQFGATSSGTDVDSTAYTAFLGVPGPRKPNGGFGFDVGAESAHQFRAYAWGPGGPAWKMNSAWSIRVANQFDLETQWATAPTHTPWTDIIEAAQTFGADRATRYGTSWHIDLDPDENAGIVQVNTRGTVELHFVAQSRPILSLSGARLSKLSGVVHVGGEFFWGDHEGNQFRIYRLASGQAERVASVPLGAMHRGVLIRSSDQQHLALQVVSPRGSWHIFPITENGEALAPLSYSREQLNKQAPLCHAGALGWLVSNWLPLTRLTPSAGGNVLQFPGAHENVRASQVVAKLVLNQDSLCVSALAAQAADDTPVVTGESEAPPAIGVPLILTDRRTNRRQQFRCAP